MAPLTWRDTTAPNFQTSVDAQRLSSQSLNNAFSGASDALGKFNEWQQGQAANALANNEANYPDAASQAAAAKSGALWQGVDRSKLTPAALATIDNRATTLLANATEQAKLPYVGSQAAANVGLTQGQTAGAYAGANVNNANAGQVNQNTRLTGAAAADTIEGNNLANQVSSEAGGDLNVALGKLEANRDKVSPNAYQYATQQLQQRIALAAGGAGAASGALAGAVAGQPAGQPTPVAGDSAPALTPEQVAANVQNAQKAGAIKGVECVDLTRGVAGISQPVSQWYKDPAHDATNSPAGTPLATFMNRDGSDSNRYDGTNGNDGKVGISGNDTTHTLVSAGNMKAWDQSKGRPPQLVQLYNDDSHGKIYNAKRLFAIADKDGQPLGANNPLAQGNAAQDPNSPAAVQATHTQLQSAAAGIANAAKLADSKVNNGSIASRYTDLMNDKTPSDQLIAQIKAPENKGNQFATLDPDIISRGLTTINNAARAAGAPELSDATKMALLQKYGSFQKAGWFTPNASVATLGYVPGRDGIALEDPAGLKADLAKMANPDTLAKQNMASASIAKLTSDLSSSAANEQQAANDLLNLQRQKRIHPNLDISEAQQRLKDTQADLQRRTEKLQNLTGKSPTDTSLVPSQVPTGVGKAPPHNAPASAALNAAVTSPLMR